jgi:hypothetical protein
MLHTSVGCMEHFYIARLALTTLMSLSCYARVSHLYHTLIYPLYLTCHHVSVGSHSPGGQARRSQTRSWKGRPAASTRRGRRQQHSRARMSDAIHSLPAWGHRVGLETSGSRRVLGFLEPRADGPGPGTCGGPGREAPQACTKEH